MNEKDIDRIADKILEKMRNDKEIKAEISEDREAIIRIVIAERSH